MCFSASASFTVAGMLCYIGYLTSTQIRKKEYGMVAAIPLLFAIQQAAEGVVWLTFAKTDYQMLHTFAVYTFLVFGLSIWPLWIPISLWLCEQDHSKKRILSILGCVGLFVSLCTAYVLLNYPVQVQIFNCSIWYMIDVMRFTREIGLLIYALAAVGPFFVSSLPLASFLGGALAVSLLFTYFWMYTTLISVWCFFAALFSIFTYLILRLKFPSGDFSNMRQRQTS